MAIAASPVSRGNGLLDLFRQAVPLQDRAVDFYRRLLAINDLAADMHAAKDVEQLQSRLSSYFQEWTPDIAVRLCIADGAVYKRVRLSGEEIPPGRELLFAGIRSGGQRSKDGKCHPASQSPGFNQSGWKELILNAGHGRIDDGASLYRIGPSPRVFGVHLAFGRPLR